MHCQARKYENFISDFFFLFFLWKISIFQTILFSCIYMLHVCMPRVRTEFFFFLFILQIGSLVKVKNKKKVRKDDYDLTTTAATTTSTTTTRRIQRRWMMMKKGFFLLSLRWIGRKTFLLDFEAKKKGPALDLGAPTGVWPSPLWRSLLRCPLINNLFFNFI